jgi:general secretion pathway protein G
VLGFGGCLVLIVLVGFLAALVLPRFVEHARARERQERAGREIRRLHAQLEAWAAAHDGEYPRRLEELLVPGPDGEAVLERLPRDPWGRVYVYTPPAGEEDRPELRSLGRDGRPGGQREDADVDSSGALEGSR